MRTRTAAEKRCDRNTGQIFSKYKYVSINNSHMTTEGPQRTRCFVPASTRIGYTSNSATVLTGGGDRDPLPPPPRNRVERSKSDNTALPTPSPRASSASPLPIPAAAGPPGPDEDNKRAVFGRDEPSPEPFAGLLAMPKPASA